MSEENDQSSSRKRRIIHWNPDAGREQARRHWSWPRILAWTVGGFFALLVVAGLSIRAAKLAFGPDVFQRAEGRAADQVAEDPGSAFITQAKAEQAHDLAAKSLIELRKLPQDHPVQLQQLISMQKTFDDAEALLARREFGRAFAMFDALSREMDAFSQNVKIKGEAQQAYSSIMVRINELELARPLAPGALESAYESAGAGKKLLEEGNFTGAKRVFDRGYAYLKQAEAALTNHVRENLLAGQKALGQGLKNEARVAFQAALEKSPGNEVALTGLKRADNIDRVHALLRQGADLEKRQQFADAAEAYRKAFTLDGMSAEAQAGQARAARLEQETKFAAAHTAAAAALKAKDWPKAITEFEKALKVYPNRKEVQAQLKTAKENAHKDAVQKALAKGYAYENVHQWKEARDAYWETLQLQPEQTDAKEGYARSGTIIRALLQYEKLVEAAEQLANQAEFQAAKNRFNEAMSFKPSYLQPTERVLQLQTLLQQQTQPVEVTLKSDGETWVSIVNFRQPSKFKVATWRILPGDYNIVGRRRGYRDVHMLLQVRNGVAPPVVTVACEVYSGKI